MFVGDIPQEQIQSSGSSKTRFIFNYPLRVTETVDAICRECLPFPAINFCRGPKTKNLDRIAANILGIEIGKKYNIEELADIFQKKAEEKGFIMGRNYGGNTCMEMFYGKNWRTLI